MILNFFVLTWLVVVVTAGKKKDNIKVSETSFWRDNIECSAEYNCPPMFSLRKKHNVSLCIKTRTDWYRLVMTRSEASNERIRNLIVFADRYFQRLNRGHIKDPKKDKSMNIIRIKKDKNSEVSILYSTPKLKGNHKLVSPCSDTPRIRGKFVSDFKKTFCSNGRAHIYDMKRTCFYASTIDMKDKLENIKEGQDVYIYPKLVMKTGNKTTTLKYYYESNDYLA